MNGAKFHGPNQISSMPSLERALDAVFHAQRDGCGWRNRSQAHVGAIAAGGPSNPRIDDRSGKNLPNGTNRRDRRFHSNNKRRTRGDTTRETLMSGADPTVASIPKVVKIGAKPGSGLASARRVRFGERPHCRHSVRHQSPATGLGRMHPSMFNKANLG
jgi:hypothetical protein